MKCTMFQHYSGFQFHRSEVSASLKGICVNIGTRGNVNVLQTKAISKRIHSNACAFIEVAYSMKVLATSKTSIRKGHTRLYPDVGQSCTILKC